MLRHSKLFAGLPFLLELNPQGLKLICSAAKLDAGGLADLIDCSEALAVELLQGTVEIDPGMMTALEQAFGFQHIRLNPPGPTPLCEFSGRALRIWRKGHGLKFEAVSAQTGISVRYLKYLEAGKNKEPSPAMRKTLGEAFGFRFFLF